MRVMHQNLIPEPPHYMEEVCTTCCIIFLFLRAWCSLSQSSSCIQLCGMQTRNTPNKITPVKASQAFLQQQMCSADSNLHLCCTTHLSPAHLFLQCRCQPGTFPGLPARSGLEPSPGDRHTSPCSVPVCKVHTLQHSPWQECGSLQQPPKKPPKSVMAFQSAAGLRSATKGSWATKPGGAVIAGCS